MNKTLILESALGFILGIILCGSLFLLFEMFSYPESAVPDVLLSLLFLPVIEEVFKYLPLQSSLFKRNYIIVGLMIGLGFGMLENFIYIYPYFSQFGSILFSYRIKATLLHIFTGGVMGFAVSKNKGWLGLMSAITIHSLFNFFIGFD